jgi:hypothetical protein
MVLPLKRDRPRRRRWIRGDVTGACASSFNFSTPTLASRWRTRSGVAAARQA